MNQYILKTAGLGLISGALADNYVAGLLLFLGLYLFCLASEDLKI